MFRTSLMMLALSASTLASGCGSGVGAIGARAETAVLVIESRPSDVDVFVDGRFWGNTRLAPQGAVPVPVRARRLELRADGYYPHRRDLELEPDRSYTLRVSLVRELK